MKLRKFAAWLMCLMMVFNICPVQHNHAHAEETCTHANTYTETWHQNVTYAQKDNNVHTMTGDAYAAVYCSDCGETLESGLVATGEVWEASHEYVDGTCVGCGWVSTCAHGNTVTTVDARNKTSIVSTNEDSHTVICDLYDLVYCEDCSNYISKTLTASQVEYAEKHVMVGDTCEICDYKCLHLSCSGYEVMTDMTYAVIDNKTHQVTGNRCDRVQCDYCGEVWYELKEANATETQNHAYDDANGQYSGTCSLCGHVNTCAHENADSDTGLRNMTWESIDNKYHYDVGELWSWVNCDDCGYHTEEKIKDEEKIQYPHLYQAEDGTPSNTCLFCGHVNTCTHENMESGTYMTDSVVTSVDNKYHAVTGTQMQWNRCSDCGYYEDVVIAENVTETSEHSYWQDDQYTGTCSACGHVNTCAHENVETWTDVRDLTWVSVDNRYHLDVGTEWQITSCQDCDYRAEALINENYSKQYEHGYWDDNGNPSDTCAFCGHVNTCTHENAEIDTYMHVIEWVAIDNKYHNDVGELRQRTYCPECAYSEEAVIEENHTEQYPHGYWDDNGDYSDTCAFCGWVNTCTHENADYGTHIEGDWTATDEKTHSRTGEIINTAWCPDCEAQILYEETGETGTQTENHSFWAWNESTQTGGYSDVCDGCGYVNTCTHPNAESRNHVRNAQYAYVDESTHSVTGELWYVSYCPDCDCEFVNESSGTMVTEYSDHYYFSWDESLGTEVYSGVCMDCGYENPCSHANTETWVEVRDGVYAYVDENDHSVTGQGYQITWCPDCSFVIEDVALGEITQNEGHDYFVWDESAGTNVYAGQCVRCGAEDPCEHANAREVENIANAVFTPKDAVYHVVEGEQWIMTWCFDCQKQISENAPTGEYISRDEMHYFKQWDAELGEYVITNVCSVCGYEATCIHENITSQIVYADERVEYQDEYMHVIVRDVYDRVTCDDCGVEIAFENTGETDVIEGEHSYYEYNMEIEGLEYTGICWACDYKDPCPHSATEEGVAVFSPELIAQNDTYHLVVGDKYITTHCLDCDKDIAYEATGETHSYEENHYYNHHGENGILVYNETCSGCGHVNACAHTDVEVWQDLRNTVVGESKDDMYHYVVGDLWNVARCTVCEAVYVYEDSGEDGQETEYHHYYQHDEELGMDVYTGECSVCGHVNGCAHSNMDTHTAIQDPVYAQKDEKYHTATGYAIYLDYCFDCENMIREERSTEEVTIDEEHYYFFYDEETDTDVYSNTCVYCGYENPCQHLNVVEEEENCAWYEATAIDDKQHEGIVDIAHFIWCEDCETTILYEIIAERTTIVEDHWFYEWDSGLQQDVYTGVCDWCGYEKTCEHANVEEELEYGWNDHTSIDDKQHLGIADVSKNVWCVDCRTLISSEVVEIGAEIIENHDYYAWDDENQTDVYVGVCEWCGHENGCAHSNMEAWMDLRDAEYTQLDEYMHSASGYATYIEYCPDCDAMLSFVETDEWTTREEEHQLFAWDDENGVSVYTGVCEWCGYENACEHINSYEWENYEWKEVQSVDDKCHSGLADVYRVVWCDDCLYEVSKECIGENVEITENHWYHAWDDENQTDVYTGICGLCGHENACSHPNGDEWSYIEGDNYAQLNDAFHTHTGYVVYLGYCPDCEVEYKHEIGDTEETWEEYHYYYVWDEENQRESYTGVCQYCGFENICEHLNKYDYEAVNSFESVFISDETHLVRGEHIYEVWCPDCESVLETKVLNANYATEEYHTFRDGTCLRCGYANNCDHAHMSPVKYIFEAEYCVENEDGTHSEFGCYYGMMSCVDCGETQMVDRDDNYEVVLSAGEVCSRCGYVVPDGCSHKYTRRYYWIDVKYYKKVNEQSHYFYGPYCLFTECADCGTLISREIMYTNMYRPEEHDLVDGVCTKCGYEEVCSHAYRTYEFEHMSNSTSVSISNAEHERTGDLYSETVCADCGATLENKLVAENTTITEQHDFVDGVCMWCQHANECQHTNVDVSEYNGAVAYRTNDDDACEMYAPVYTYTYCMDCLEAFSDELTGEVIYGTQNHGYLDGVCQACGYVNTCEHTNLDIYENTDKEYYTAINNREHTWTYDKYKSMTCLDCGEYFDEQLADGAVETQEHIFVNEVCELCGYHLSDELNVYAAEFASDKVAKGTAVDAVIVTDVDAQYLHMHAENGALVKTWNADSYSVVQLGERVWTISYSFVSTGDRVMTFKVSDDGVTMSESGAQAKVTVVAGVYAVTEAAFVESVAYRNENVQIVAKTGADAQYLAMYDEGGSLVKTLTAAENAVAEGDALTWNVEFAFAGGGVRQMTFKSSIDNKNFSTGIADSIVISSGVPAVGYAAFDQSEVAKGASVGITVVTNADATQLKMYAEGDALVKTWNANGNSTVEDGERVWHVTYAFASTGNRSITFKATKDGSTMGYAQTAKVSVVVARAYSVLSAAFEETVAYTKETVNLTVETGADAQYLMMYAEGGDLVKTWNASGNSIVSGTVRVWNLTYAFGGGGVRTVSFKGSYDGTATGTSQSASIVVSTGVPAVGYAAFDQSEVAKGASVGITVVTNADATQLKMYAEGDALVKTWNANGNSTVEDGERVWHVTYAFASTGNRSITFKATKDGSTMGYAQTAKVSVVVARAYSVLSAQFEETVAYTKETVNLTVETGADAQYLMMYAEGGGLVKTWNASGNSIVSGTVRVWNVTYAFGGGGVRTVSFKGSYDGTVTGTSQSASIVISTGVPAVGYAAFGQSEAMKGETINIVVKTNADATQLKMYSEGGGLVKTWNASGNSVVAGTERIWNVTYAFGGTGNRVINFKATKDGSTMGFGMSDTITITAN